MNGSFFIKRLYLFIRPQKQNRGSMLFEHLQSFLLARNKEMERIHKTSNQIRDLRFMVFYEAHSCGQRAPGSRELPLSLRECREEGDKSSREFAIQHFLSQTPVFPPRPKVVRESLNDKRLQVLGEPFEFSCYIRFA